jgi:hypothetical protein
MPRLAILILGLALSGCLASIHYGLSDVNVPKERMKHLGPFSVDASGCGSYSTSSAGENIIKPAVQEKLRELGANAADNVEAKERWYDIPLGMLIVPALLGCSNWIVTGDALLIERS